MSFLLVAFGGAVGSVGRYATTLLVARLLGPAYPFGTLAVNVAGSFAMGMVAETLARRTGSSDALRLLVMTGFLGGYTTFSSYTLDAVLLWQRGEHGAAAAYALASVVLGLAALLVGMAVARHFVPLR